MKKKIFTPLLAILIMCCFIFVGCGSDNSSSSDSNPPTPPNGFVNPGDNLGGGGTGTLPTETIVTTADDYDFDIDLSELKSETSTTNYTSLTGSTEQITISTAGDYILSGTFENGIVISVGNNEITHLFLNNATILNSNGIAISNTNKKSTLIITAMDNTTSTVSNEGEDVNCVHVKGILKINGTGTINISSSSKNAIKVSKDFVVCNTTLTISSNNHGISAKSITSDSANITISTASKDGLNAECDDDTTEFPTDYSEGYVKLINTTFTCSVYGDGIQADTLVYIDGGNINIQTIGNFVIYSTENISTYELEQDDFRYTYNGATYKKVASDYNGNIKQMYALSQSCKGIKVGEIKYEDTDGNEISVSDGDYLILIKGSNNIIINSADDAIHTNCGNTIISDGNLNLTTYDDGITSDYLTQINGGIVTISSCYEGIEGAYVKITNGTITITSNDDAINSASDDESIKEYIIISGGNITIDASGDGLDSNGSILISGGNILIFGPTSGGDAGMDADSGILVNGGNLFVSSSLGMIETPASNSTSYVVSYAQNTEITNGTVISIKNSDNEEIFNTTIKKNCQSLIICLDSFENSKSYTIFGDNTELANFTISSTITTIGSSNNGPSGTENPPDKPNGPNGNFGRR